MRTLIDVVETATDLYVPGGTSGVFPAGYTPKLRLPIVGDKPLTLPLDVAGLTPLTESADSIGELTHQQAEAARVRLLCNPGATFPLEKPNSTDLVALGINSDSFRSERPRRFCSAVALRVSSQLLYGVAQILAIENGLRMGSTKLVGYFDRWTFELDEAEEWLFHELRNASNLVQVQPEPGATPWRTAVALLGGIDKSSHLPNNWKRQMKMAAGLRRVLLDIRSNPESARREVIHDLKVTPPDALLVWIDWVANPEIFVRVFETARPGAFVDLLGTHDGSMSFDETISELFMHLRQIEPIVEGGVSSSSRSKFTNWDDAGAEILRMEGTHFKLTDRVRDTIKSNKYKDPDRMVKYVRKLADLASMYRERNGQLGGRVADVAMSVFKIEVAMFDGSISPFIFVDGRKLSTLPHVKVDDAKSPDECGRIYFAIDNVDLCFRVDHIGLHDYP